MHKFNTWALKPSLSECTQKKFTEEPMPHLTISLGSRGSALFHNFSASVTHLHSVYIQKRCFTYHDRTHFELSYDFREHLKVWTVPGFVQDVVAFFTLVCVLNLAEVAVHVPRSFCSKSSFNFFSYRAEIVDFSEPALLSGVEV